MVLGTFAGAIQLSAINSQVIIPCCLMHILYISLFDRYYRNVEDGCTCGEMFSSPLYFIVHLLY